MHKYVRSGKFKNTNCGYALVRGIVFGSIYEAEEYCTAKGYDPNVWIEADSDAVLSRCQQIARAALPCLCQALEEQRILCEILGREARAEAAALEAAKEKHELGWEVHRDWLQHAAGKVGGCYDGMEIIRRRITMLERIIRIRPAPKEALHHEKERS
jgi:hypothetical protein